MKLFPCFVIGICTRSEYTGNVRTIQLSIHTVVDDKWTLNDIVLFPMTPYFTNDIPRQCTNDEQYIYFFIFYFVWFHSTKWQHVWMWWSLVFNATFNNIISVISWWSVLLLEETAEFPEKITDLSEIEKTYFTLPCIRTTCRQGFIYKSLVSTNQHPMFLIRFSFFF